MRVAVNWFLFFMFCVPSIIAIEAVMTLGGKRFRAAIRPQFVIFHARKAGLDRPVPVKRSGYKAPKKKRGRK